MFKVGQEYLTNAGLKARVICNDAAFKPSTATIKLLNVIAIITQKTGNEALHYFDDDGNYAGVSGNSSYTPHNLVSDEPTAEEATLIADIFGLVENGATERGSREQVLKIIRKLRTK